jgi:hypothetical protein
MRIFLRWLKRVHGWENGVFCGFLWVLDIKSWWVWHFVFFFRENKLAFKCYTKQADSATMVPIGAGLYSAREPKKKKKAEDETSRRGSTPRTTEIAEAKGDGERVTTVGEETWDS